MPKLNLAHIHLHQQPDGTREICVAPEYLAHGAQVAAYYQARDTPPRCPAHHHRLSAV